MYENKNNLEYDDDTLDTEGQYIDIDDDSNTQHSTGLTNYRTTASNFNRLQTITVPTNNNNDLYMDIDLDSESASSEYSDWAEEDGRQTLKPPPRRNSRQKRNKRKKRTLRVEDYDEENAEYDEDDSFIRATKKRTDSSRATRKAKRIVSDEEDSPKKICNSKGEEENTESDFSEEDQESSENELSDENYDSIDGNKPCTSNTVRNAKTPKKRGRKPLKEKSRNNNFSKSVSSVNKKEFSKSSKTNQVNNKGQLNNVLKGLPIEYRPPEWLTGTKPKKSPYVPQIGDEVVYFSQGHRLYVDAVKNTSAYEIDETSLPWNSVKTNFEVQQICKVVGLKIEIKPPRLVCLKLCIIDKQTNKMTNSKFSIKYHDMDNVVDFVILRQFFDRGIEKNWRAKDRFKCIIDDVWWIGIIECRKPFEENYPESEFQCLKITWDSGESEALSPWDLESLSGVNSRKTKPVSLANLPNNGESITVTQEEMNQLLYVPNTDEWPIEGREYECQRILNGLEKIMELSLAEHFNYPVDLDAFPSYGMYIQYPIDLNTIKERLENRYYRRINSIIWDIRKIEQNATTFNDPKSPIVKNATFLTELLIEFVTDTHCTNPIPIYKRLCKDKKLPQDSDETEIENSILNKTIYENEDENDDEDTEINHSKSTRGRGKNLKILNDSNSNKTKEAKTIKKTSALDTWQTLCQKLIEDLIAHPDSEPFREAVDLNAYPDYLEIIESTPMDLGTICSKIKQNEYSSLKMFDVDCKQIFKNSKSYNTIKRSKIYGMTLRLSAFYEERITNITEKVKNEDISKYGRAR